MNWKDIFTRAAKTAVAAALPLLVVTDLSTAESAAITGLTAGVTVVINAVLNWSRS